MSFKNILTLITLSFLVYSIFNFKSYLSLHFIKNDSKIKQVLNKVLNGDV